MSKVKLQVALKHPETLQRREETWKRTKVDTKQCTAKCRQAVGGKVAQLLGRAF